jgi:hypothetical protein
LSCAAAPETSRANPRPKSKKQNIFFTVVLLSFFKGYSSSRGWDERPAQEHDIFEKPSQVKFRLQGEIYRIYRE